MSAKNIHIVCIGNELVADDAVGHEVHRHLQTLDLPSEVTVHYAAVGGVALLDTLTGGESAMIVVDAVRFGAPPGTLHLLDWADVPDFRAGAISAHQIGLRETLEIGRLLYPEKLPETLLLLGIEGACFDRPREAMTPEVAQAILPAVDCILKTIDHLQ